MSDGEPDADGIRDGWLADYRRAVEMMRWETMAEVGRQPMPPEALSGIALAVTALAMLALLLPSVPVEPHFGQVSLALTAVWLGTFCIQSLRYTRFHNCWHRKIAAHAAMATAVRPSAPRYRRAQPPQRRSGQTSGGDAAR